jgi:hypothetical protein
MMTATATAMAAVATTARRSNKYLTILMEKVLLLSRSQVWEEARKEWIVVGCTDLEKEKGVCTCTKEDLRYLFTIWNTVTRKSLFPIGSQCISHFGNKAMTDKVGFLERLDKMGKRMVRYGKHGKKMFKEVPQSYIDFLRGVKHLKYATYRQLIEYDDMRKEAAAMKEQTTTTPEA